MQVPEKGDEAQHIELGVTDGGGKGLGSPLLSQQQVSALSQEAPCSYGTSIGNARGNCAA